MGGKEGFDISENFCFKSGTFSFELMSTVIKSDLSFVLENCHTAQIYMLGGSYIDFTSNLTAS